MEVYTLHEIKEEPGIRRMKKSLAFVLLMLLLSAMLCAAEAEEPAPATPTDLSCLHENTKQTIYFFDSPAYTSVSSTSHKVYGPATIQTICLDCGEVLSTETVDYAEELRPLAKDGRYRRAESAELVFAAVVGHVAGYEHRVKPVVILIGPRDRVAQTDHLLNAAGIGVKACLHVGIA